MTMLNRVKRTLKPWLPKAVLEAWRRARRFAEHLEFKRLGRRETFTRIYAKNLWGGQPGEFCSGLGSTDTHADNYAKMVREFIASHDVRSVVDLGCGDFRVAARFIGPGLDYTGVDIVPELIAHNQAHHGSETLRFLSRDILEDDLPRADLCLIRQVLQHISNDEIQTVLTRLSGFTHVIVTEHVPNAAHLRAPNHDKPHGPDTRIPEGSGVFLEHAPFSIAGCATLLDVPADPAKPEVGGRIRSQAFQPSSQTR